MGKSLIQEEAEIRKKTEEWLENVINSLKACQQFAWKEDLRSINIYMARIFSFEKNEYKSANHLIQYVIANNEKKAGKMKELNDLLVGMVAKGGKIDKIIREASIKDRLKRVSREIDVALDLAERLLSIIRDKMSYE